MPSSLSNLVNSFVEKIHKIKCKYKHDGKNVKLVESNKNVFLNTQILKII